MVVFCERYDVRNHDRLGLQIAPRFNYDVVGKLLVAASPFSRKLLSIATSNHLIIKEFGAHRPFKLRVRHLESPS